MTTGRNGPPGRRIATIAILLTGIAAAVIATSCQAHIEPHQFRCVPNEPNTCPKGWVCLGWGDAHYCYASPGVCGNGIAEPGEECDTHEFAPGLHCATEDATVMLCTPDCTVECHGCGDGRLGLRDDRTLEECDDGNRNAGDGCDVSCRREGCGNGTLDVGEVCDDGNLEAGDGCSMLCRPELCGNGVVDSGTGEECDDGNLRSRDGCSSRCTVEIPQWGLFQSAMEAGRSLHAMAYHTATSRTVLFGGFDGASYRNDTWVHDGQSWRHLPQDHAPPPRAGHAMVYDTTRERLVLFGGYDGGGYLDDVWTFDGTAWAELPTFGAPPARGRFAMAYDDARDRVVVFGGADGAGPRGDTWELAEDTWEERTFLGTPAARESHAMAYDPVREQVVLFGGFDGEALLRDTWTYNGVAWVQRSSSGPTARRGHAMAYDPTWGGVVVQGGTTLIVMSTSDLHLFDGATWQYQFVDSNQGSPAERSEHALVFDAARERLLLYGGRNLTYLADTWEITPASTWVDATPPTRPPARAYAGMTYDSARGRAVLFGGAKNSTFFSYHQDTWEYDGAQWVQVLTDAAPSARMIPAMAYDEARGVTVLFGGFHMSVDAETWEYDGTTWVETTPGLSPPARAAARLVYDTKRQRLVLFGGTTASLTTAANFFDTWEYDGTAWVEVSPEDSPPSRAFHSMVYDDDRGRAVLFSGSSMLASEITGTWEHDGSRWWEVTPYLVPPFRGEAAMVYSKARHRTTLFGGQGNGVLWDTWEYDGASWTQLFPPLSPSPRSGVAAAYDAQRRTMVIFGGSPAMDETWEFSFRSALADEACGDGADNDGDGLVDCDDPDCDAQPRCAPREDCANGMDDDGDGRLDCADPSCGGATCAPRLVCTGLGEAAACACAEGHWESNCTDGRDNDCDGLVDDDDPECTACDGWIPIGCGTMDGSTVGGPEAFTSYGCLPGWELLGPEAYYGFTAPRDGPVTVTVTGTGQGDPDLVVTGANGHDRCEPVHQCLGSSSLAGLPERVTFAAGAGQTYFFIVDSFAAAPATFRIEVQCD